jgi:uncharacterized protein YaaN involved in tellurite resistance
MSNKVSSVSKEFTDISSALNVLNNKLTEDNTLLEQLTREYNAISVNFNRLANLLHKFDCVARWDAVGCELSIKFI